MASSSLFSNSTVYYVTQSYLFINLFHLSSAMYISLTSPTYSFIITNNIIAIHLFYLMKHSINSANPISDLANTFLHLTGIFNILP